MLPLRARHTPNVNRLLASLQADDSTLLTSMARIEHPPANHSIGTRTHPTADVWFPHGGFIALSVTDQEGRTVQTGVVGSEGCTGLETLFHGTPAMADTWIQIAGDISVISAVQLRSVLDARPAIQAALARFLYELSAQSLQTVACNRLHTLEARCCRWLLMIRDRTGNDDLPLTQESLATLLGSGRPRINVLLAALEQNSLLQRYRGRIRLLDHARLATRACECYRLLSHR